MADALRRGALPVGQGDGGGAALAAWMTGLMTDDGL